MEKVEKVGLAAVCAFALINVTMYVVFAVGEARAKRAAAKK